MGFGVECLDGTCVGRKDGVSDGCKATGVGAADELDLGNEGSVVGRDVGLSEGLGVGLGKGGVDGNCTGRRLGVPDGSKVTGVGTGDDWRPGNDGRSSVDGSPWLKFSATLVGSCQTGRE